MPKFGADVTNVQTNTPTYIRQGFASQGQAVIDQAKAQSYETLGKVASEAIDEYSLSRFQSEQEKNVSDYLVSREAQREQVSAKAEIEDQSSTLDNLLSSVKGPLRESDQADFYDNVVGPVEKNLQDQLARYKKAADVGRITPEQLRVNILNTTKKYAANNPALYDRIIRRSSQVLELSGIQEIVKADQLLAEQQAKTYHDFTKNLESEAHKLNLHDQLKYDRNGQLTNPLQVKAAIDVIARQKRAADLLKNASSISTEQSKLQGIDFARELGPDAVNGLYSGAIGEFTKETAAEKNPDTRLFILRQKLLSVEQLINSKAQGIQHEAPVKSVLDFAKFQREYIEKQLTDVNSHEELARRLGNIQKIIGANNTISIYQAGINPLAIDIASRAIQAYPALLDQKSAVFKQYTGVIDKLTKGITNDPSVNLLLTNEGGQLLVPSLATNTLIRQSATGDVSAQKGLDNYIRTVNSELQNKDKFPNTQEGFENKYKFYDKYIGELANPNSKKGLETLSPEARQAASTNVADFGHLVLSSLVTDLNTARAQGAKVQFDSDKDGKLIIRSDNKALEADLNTRYSSRFNQALQATANLAGSNPVSIAGEFYNNYRQIFQPVEIRSAEEAKQALEIGQISRKDYNTILKDLGVQPAKKSDSTDSSTYKGPERRKEPRITEDELKAQEQKLADLRKRREEQAKTERAAVKARQTPIVEQKTYRQQQLEKKAKEGK